MRGGGNILVRGNYHRHRHGDEDHRALGEQDDPILAEVIVVDFEVVAQHAAANLAADVRLKDEDACDQRGHGRLDVIRDHWN